MAIRPTRSRWASCIPEVILQTVQTFKLLTKLLVILALCPPFAAAEGLRDGVKAGAGNAYDGMAVRRDETERNDMKITNGGGGFSYGRDRFASELVVLFEDEAAFSRFVEQGFDSSAEARGSVAGKSADVAKPFGRGTPIDRVTESGARLEATLFGTRFRSDEALNAPHPVRNDRCD
jgi:hypothetical protein